MERPMCVIGLFLANRVCSYLLNLLTLHYPLRASFLAFLITDGNSVFALLRYADLILSVVSLSKLSGMLFPTVYLVDDLNRVSFFIRFF